MNICMFLGRYINVFDYGSFQAVYGEMFAECLGGLFVCLFVVFVFFVFLLLFLNALEYLQSIIIPLYSFIYVSIYTFLLQY